ncbi:chemotaxis protein CheA [Plesiocystis pacifica SIR-1]|uniref:histidine kinase n=1 Tax=Plesiocystis pacifica SIR-1 TaxID=391625 RepID=A6G722_9BACT|nr:chemotaxis protein CheA [Plesiocystis pacifica]EDM78298.1 chemotaxis protein CheA [Plesiocystis pacifica SIR-1]
MSESPEFVSEAQEIIETFSRQLLEIEGQLRDGDDYDPDLLNGAFRSVHTLKGLSSLSGVNEIVDLSHKLENTLDALRLGKLPLNQSALDLLFESVDLFGRLLAGVVEPDGGQPVEVDSFLAKLAKLAEAPEEQAEDALSWLDDSILGVLTEYEEHRLRENVRLGRAIYRIHASFDLLAIDVGIEALKAKLKNYGEVITYLPSADLAADDRIELGILMGSKHSIPELADGIAEEGVAVEALATGERFVIPAPSEAPEPLPEPEPEPAPTTSSSGTRVEAIDDDDFPDDEDDGSSSGSAPDSGGSASAPAGGDSGGASSAGGDGRGGDRGGSVSSEPPMDDGGDQVSLKSLSQTVRVDLRRLDHLMNLVGELALVHANLTNIGDRMQRTQLANHIGGLSSTSGEHLREFQDQLRVMNRRLSLLQQGILEVRMVPLGQVFDKLARVVRKLGRESQKDIRLAISGAETELDKLIVEELSDPLMHMIRNAIDHGIELPAERVAVGKPRAGKISLSAFQKGNRVVIELTDDGRGMDWRIIRDKAVKRGFVSAEESSDITPGQAINLIFTPGFSTRDKATELSGRGVGMDVVKTNISRLSGMIDVASEPGRGSRFRITLPVTLAIIQALVIETSGQTFCIPLNSVLESIMVQSDEIQTIEGHEVVSVRGRTLPLIHLSKVFELGEENPIRDPRSNYDRLYVVVVGLAQHRVGLVVDELLGQQDVVIKPIGRALRQVPGIAGATELGDNRTVLLLDVATLVGEAVGGVEAAVGSGGGREGIGVFSNHDVGREKEHGGWGDHGF